MHVAVVGSGVSGVAAAHHLAHAGVHVDLLERDDTLGGRFGVAMLGDRPVMMGGKNIGRKYTGFRAFTAALGEHPYEEFGINSSRVMDGKLLSIDSERRVGSLRNAFQGAAPRDVLRLVRLARQVRADEANRFLGGPAFTRIAARRDGSPLSAHFGPAITQHLLRPITVRMNGAEPDEVYLGTLGTNLALMLDTFDQLTGGIQPVLEAVAARVTVRSGSPVQDVVIENGRVTGVETADGRRRYDGVVLAVPAPAAAEILSARPTLSHALAHVRYFPTTVALVEYDRPVFSATVRALALDDGPCSNAGAYGRDDRHIVRYTFSGREARTLDPSDALIKAWIDEGEMNLRRYVPESHAAARVRSLARHWSRGYCGYVPFHGEFLAGLRREVAQLSGLALAGDYLLGASIEACYRSGAQAAAALLDHARAQVMV